jgi:hypothetical protein
MNRPREARDGQLPLQVAQIPGDTRNRPSRRGRRSQQRRHTLQSRRQSAWVRQRRGQTAQQPLQIRVPVVHRTSREFRIDHPGLHELRASCGNPCTGTATCGLYERNQLGLPYASLKPDSTGKVLIIRGGSTSVGCKPATQSNWRRRLALGSLQPAHHAILTVQEHRS